MNKNTTVFLLLCLLSLAMFHNAFAAIPQIPGGHFFISGEGMFARQLSQGTIFAVRDFGEDAIRSPLGSTVDINTNYRLSGGGAIGYLFKSGLDIKLSFFVHNHSDTKLVSAPLIPNENNPEGNLPISFANNPFHLDPTLIPSDFQPTSTLALKAKSTFSYQTFLANFALGSWLKINRFVWFHPNIGINLSNIETSQKTHYEALLNGDFNLDPNLYANIEESARTTAIGPFLGLDFFYTLLKPVSLELGTQLGMLLGKLNSRHYGFASLYSQQVKVSQKTNPAIIEYLNMQAALHYHFAPSRLGKADIAAGYRLSKYKDTASAYNFPDTSDSALIHFFEHSGFHGPFLSLTLLMM